MTRKQLDVDCIYTDYDGESHLCYYIVNGVLYYRPRIDLGGIVTETGEYIRKKDIPFGDSYSSLQHAILIYYNTKTDDWYRLLSALARKTGGQLWLNSKGNAMIVSRNYDNYKYRLFIDKDKFEVTTVMEHNKRYHIEKATVGMNAFTIIKKYAWKEFDGDMSHIKEYTIRVRNEYVKGIKKEMNRYVKMVNGLFDVAISCRR